MSKCDFCPATYKVKSSLTSHKRTKHKEELDEKIRRAKEAAKAKKELAKEPEVLQEAIEDEEIVEMVDMTMERVKKTEELTKFAQSMKTRKTKVSLVAEPKWLSKTLGRGLGDKLGNLAVPLPPSCRECIMMTNEIKDHDKMMQEKNEELEEKAETIKELGGVLELMASQASGAPGVLKEVQELKDEISNMKEVMDFQEKSLQKKDEELEKKKEEIKKQKLELIRLGDELKKVKKDEEAVQVVTSREKNRETKKKPTEASQQKKDEIQCTKCDKKEKSKSDLMIHMDLVHKEHDVLVRNATREEWPTLAQGTLCRNGENCSWKRNNRCKFVHPRSSEVESHKSDNHSSRRREEEPELCRNGPECGYKRNGVCKFSHHQERSHGRWQQQQRRHGFRRHNRREHREEEEEPVFRNVRNPGEPVGWCLDGDNCRRKRFCMYKHTKWQHENLASFQRQAMQWRN